MAAPTATDVREFLEGYGISTSILSDTWIENRMFNSIIPHVRNKTGLTFDGEQNVTEYLSGNGESILMLSSPNVTSIVSIDYVLGGDVYSNISLAGVELLEGGVLKAISNVTEGGSSTLFRKGNRNVKIVYKTGYADYPDDIKEAIVMLTCEFVLGFVGARTGGGALTVEGFSRNFGKRGKYQDIRNDLKRQAYSLLYKYMSNVVGSI